MSSTLVQVLVAITKGASINTPTGAAFASTSVVVTDSTGVAQPAVLLTGIESPPWSFTTSVAPGNGTAVATDLDISGAVLGTPVTQTFTEAGSPPTFLPTTGISVTPTANTAAVAAVRAAAVKR
jgi:hypothetical protein